MDAVRDGEYQTGEPPLPSPWHPGDDPHQLVKIEMPQLANWAVRELVGDGRIGEWAARITGAKWVQVWWVQLLQKPPSTAPGADATHVGWHQDRQYWGAWEAGSELLTAWVALSEVKADSGPMRLWRGSHRWGLLNQGDFYAQDTAAQQLEMRLPPGATLEEVPALLPAGGVSFHHCLTFHASGPNRSGEIRRSFALHLRTENSAPADGKRAGLTRFIDDLERCPVIFGG